VRLDAGRCVAADLAAADGLAGVDFLPSQFHLPADDGAFLLLFAAALPDKAGPFAAVERLLALVADDSVLMFGPRDTRLV
jgi:hypothetical protein